MAEAHASGVNLTDAQYDLYDRLSDIREEIVDATVRRWEAQRRYPSPTEVTKMTKAKTLTLGGMGVAVSTLVNKSRCPGGNPQTRSSPSYDEVLEDLETGFVVTCENICPLALSKQCPLSRLPQFVDEELAGLGLQIRAEAVEVREWLAA